LRDLFRQAEFPFRTFGENRKEQSPPTKTVNGELKVLIGILFGFEAIRNITYMIVPGAAIWNNYPD